MQGARYYGWLATTLPPRHLALAAVRRLRRRALDGVRAVSEPFERPFDLATLLKVPSLEQGARRIRENVAARGPVSPQELQLARAIVQRHLPDHAREVCERADKVLAGELWAFGSWREQSRGELEPGIAALDWTRDPLHGSHAPDVESRLIDRDAPGTDARAVWEAGRLAMLVWLAQAHLLVGLPGTEKSVGARRPGLYARALSLQVRDFLATQPIGQGIHWTCAMEAALRGMNLSLALSLVRHEPSLDAPFWSDALRLLFGHSNFIEAHLEDAQTVPGNHLLSDLAGLATIAMLFPELPGAFERREQALVAFARGLIAQTTPEGLSFESSTAYHRFVTEMALVLEATARRQGLSLGVEALERLSLMCEVVQGATLSDGRLVQAGDNDSSRAIATTLRSPLDPRHIASLRSALWGEGMAEALPEVLWSVGVSGFTRLGPPPAPKPRHFAASGLGTLVDGSRSASLWAASNGQLGLGGHAHNDKLSCEVVLENERISIDPGCPVYLADLRERDRYRSTGAHPTLRVDATEQGEIPEGRAFLLPESAHARIVSCAPRRLLAEHRGYARLNPSLIHRREVSLPEGASAVVVTDRVLGSGEHVCELFWPLTRVQAQVEEAGPADLEALGLVPEEEGEGRIDYSRVIRLAGEPCVLLAIACEQPWEVLTRASTWSPGYGERRPGCTVQVVVHARLPLVISSVFTVVR